MGEPQPSKIRRTVGFLAGVAPTLVVMGLIGAIGWWGVSTDWKLTKFSALSGEKAEADDWCAEHAVPESICVECNPDLMPKPKPRGWDRVHGLPECVLCNPELAQLPHASVSQEDLVRAKRALDFAPRQANNPACKLHEHRVQFASDRDVEKAGIEFDTVQLRPVEEFIAAPGEIGYDQTRVVHLSSRSAGSVWRVFKHLGDRVEKGELLALIDAAEVGKAKAEVLQAFAALQTRTQTLAALRESSGVVSETKLREAEAAAQESQIRLDAGRQALVNLGLPLAAADVQNITAQQLKARLQALAIPADVARTLDPKNSTTNLLPVHAPMDGIIVSRDVVAGEVVSPMNILFEIVDNRTLWLTCDVTSEKARLLKVGQKVLFKADDAKDELAGKLSWVSTQADPKTRTVKVRADISDPEGKLRAHVFGTGRVMLREEDEAVTVPNSAIHWEGDCNIVFVRDKNWEKPGAFKVFHVRKVRPAAKGPEYTEVIGVLPGEYVVTRGGGVLLAGALSRDNHGDGCAHDKKDKD
jgi:cobalt-zinc-cadmium efflux system membrane fusion protein